MFNRETSMPAAQRHASAHSDAIPQKVWRAGTLTYTTTGLIVLFGWLLWGDFAWSMKDRTLAPLLPLLLKKFSASDTLTGILLGSLPLLTSMILSPIVSYKSDHHRGRWGRRIPFLLIPTPVIALAMAGLAWSPAGGAALHRMLGSHSPGLNDTTLLLLGFFWTIFEFSTAVANSVFNGLINDVVPQPVMGRFYGAFRAVSLVAGILFSFLILGEADSEYVWIFLGMGALYGAGFSMMCLKVKEGDYPPPHLDGEVGNFFVAARDYFRKCFSHSYYGWFYGATALSWMAFMPINLFSLFYAQDIKLDLHGYAHCVGWTFCISLLLSYPLGILADRLHPLRLALIMQLIYILTTLGSGLFVKNANTFAVALVLNGVLSGTWMTAAASLGQRLLPGENFAQFASAAGIIGALGGIVVGPLVGLFLDHVHHQYVYTFFISSGLATVALLAGLVLYKKFLALGGPANYVAPT